MVNSILKRVVFVFLVIFAPLVRAEELLQHTQIDFNFDRDRNLTILQRLYAHAVLCQIVQERDLLYVITLNQDGRFVFEGTEEERANFHSYFLQRLSLGLSPVEFAYNKESFLQQLELSCCFSEQTLAKEVTWEDVCQSSLEIERLVTYLNSNGGKRMPSSSEDQPPGTQCYYELRLTCKDQENIDQLIQNLANRTVLELLVKKKKMRRLGNKVEVVHPLRFIGYIYSSSHLKGSLAKIYKSYFKWKNFIDGFGTRMSLELSKNNLYPYLQGFVHCTGLSFSKMEIYVRQQDWDGMVISMMN